LVTEIYFILMSHESLTERAFAAARPGDQVTLTVACGTEHLTVKVRLGELPGS
jgi:hypothetical protein